MSGNHIKTSNYKKDILVDKLSFKQDGSSTVFIKDKIFLLSPAVALNTQNYYWFDIRESNINKFDNKQYSEFKILIRIVDNGFLFFDFEELKAIMTTFAKVEFSGNKVWSFNLDIKGNKVKIVNRKDKFYLNCIKIQEDKLLELL